jgi:hypothetical protein
VKKLYNYPHVKALGREKFGAASRIKKHRRKISLAVWKLQHLMMETQHVEEYFTVLLEYLMDLQLIKVTKELRRVGGRRSDNTILSYPR